MERIAISQNPRKQMKRLCRIAWLTIIGLFVLMSGLAYDITWAGIPYQDATPDLQARYDFHRSVANWFYISGGVVVLGGLMVAPMILKQTHPHSPHHRSRRGRNTTRPR